MALMHHMAIDANALHAINYTPLRVPHRCRTKDALVDTGNPKTRVRTLSQHSFKSNHSEGTSARLCCLAKVFRARAPASVTTELIERNGSNAVTTSPPPAPRRTAPTVSLPSALCSVWTSQSGIAAPAFEALAVQARAVEPEIKSRAIPALVGVAAKAVLPKLISSASKLTAVRAERHALFKHSCGLYTVFNAPKPMLTTVVPSMVPFPPPLSQGTCCTPFLTGREVIRARALVC